MGDLGDLAEALLRAPQLRTLHAKGTQVTDHQALRRAWEADGATVGVIGLVQVDGDEHVRDDGIEIWFENTTPSRWRVDHQQSTSLSDGHHQLHRFGDDVIEQAVEDVQAQWTLSGVLEGSYLLVEYQLEVSPPTTVAGREVYVLTGVRKPRSGRPGPFGRLAGDTVEAQVDVATGIVLRCTSLFEGVIVSESHLHDIEVDVDLDDEIFVLLPAPGGRVKSLEELAAESELRHHVTVEDLAEAHIPHGPPPEDEAAAEASIRTAFVGMLQESEDGRDLPTVQAGEGLGVSVQEARNRFHRDHEAMIEVLRIVFLDDRQAVVWFDVTVGDRGPELRQREGQAVLTDAGWKVSRATVANLLAMAGVRVPPPEPG